MNPLWHRKAIWLRAFLCLSIGFSFFLVNRMSTYDKRFRFRSAQENSKDIILVTLSKEEWLQFNKDTHPDSLKDTYQPTDKFYWDPQAWSQLLNTLLMENPRAIGVTFFFGENIPKVEDSLLIWPTPFLDPKVFWASILDSNSVPMLSVFSLLSAKNTGLVEIRKESDGVVRIFDPMGFEFPHMTDQLAKKGLGLNDFNSQMFHPSEPRLINYQGPAGTFQTISITEVLGHQFSPGIFKEKIILIGSQDSQGHFFQTPLGPIPRAEVIANILDNTIHNRWIVRMSPWGAFLFLFALLIISCKIIFSNSQLRALIYFLAVASAIYLCSLWVFNSLYYWIPVLSPLIQLSVTYMVFLSYRLMLLDTLNWNLEQERKHLSQVEQLKSNFLSLISHDLKNPIAKIQAICDRLLIKEIGLETKEDINSICRESTQLHRYIQTILHITRVEARDFKILKTASDVNQIVKDIILQLEPLTHKKKVRIHQNLEPLFLIEIDPVLIQEVILNVIENAIKYSNSLGNITIETSEVGERVIINVKDDGPGIAKEDQTKIFDKFYRGGNNLNTGSGLGLYLAKYFVELHGGFVDIESQLEKGTSVTISLPVNATDSYFTKPLSQRPSESLYSISEPEDLSTPKRPFKKSDPSSLGNI